MVKYPMLLKYVPREMIWGGNRLRTKYNKCATFSNIGESWELTCRPEAVSVVANGVYAEQPLNDVLRCGYDFPLLIKFIDAHDKLSVQVHPDDNITDDNGSSLGKTEMWYIIDAEEDAHIIYGLKDEININLFTELVESNNFEKALKRIPVKPGDCYFIPAGHIHAIGSGFLLAEIQQNSDTTYRLYDYDRTDKNGNRRELHIQQALSVIKKYTKDDIHALQFSNGHECGCLSNCSKFYCKIHHSSSNIVTSDSFCVLLFIDGIGQINHNGVHYDVSAGDTYFLPSNLNVSVDGHLKFLEIRERGEKQ